jgi:predicted nucleic acid-binding protein
VLSELRKPRRDQHVVKWLSTAPVDHLYLSVITVGEVAKGIAKQRRVGTEASASHADALQSWLDGLLAGYAERILIVDVPIASRWGRLCAEHPHHPTDMLLAATALHHGLTVATRNVSHFELTRVPVVNPFQAANS